MFQPKYRHDLPQLNEEKLFLVDGGLETHLVFHKGNDYFLCPHHFFLLMPHCCDHSDGLEVIHTLFYLHCLVKGVFSPIPLTVGDLFPLNYHYHVVNLQLSRCNLFVYVYLKPVK